METGAVVQGLLFVKGALGRVYAGPIWVEKRK